MAEADCHAFNQKEVPSQRAMEVELTEHVGYEPHQEPPSGTGEYARRDEPKRSD